MRLHIAHMTCYRYERPALSAIQMLRLTPRNHASQYVAQWRIDVSTDCRLHQHEDAFGNITHAFTADGPLQELTVAVEGEVETRDTQGITRGTVERFPPSLYLRETALTQADANIAGFALVCANANGNDTLKLLHTLLERVHEEIAYDPDPTHTATSAAEAFALKRGVCQDLTHVFIAAARNLGVPARYVGGYFHRADGRYEQDAGAAWAGACGSGLTIAGQRPCWGPATAATARSSRSRSASARQCSRARPSAVAVGGGLPRRRG